MKKFNVISFFFPLLILLNCNSQTFKTPSSSGLNMDSSKHKHTNRLINETSPYLLQHAHNPVNWFPWGKEALEKAKNENKPLLISIGYSACHWCHVMEHESFEDSTVAEVMNRNFVCIKVDREERPDVDQVYMNAVQLMNQQGGWPLNCFAMPDGKPFYGGTYFPKETWLDILEKINSEYKTNLERVNEYAEKLTEGIRLSELIKPNEEKPEFTAKILDETIEKWQKLFDNKEGGPNRAPKFPLPNNYQFLLRYAHLHKRNDILEHVNLTLKKMAFGGIYDQLGGGFARYSVDSQWKVPHFEKMLYDNAQLVSLYSEAYRLMKEPLYKQVVYETLEFIEKEMTAENGAFFSALDADSEGKEGKYYVWKKEELKELLNENFLVFSDYYNVNSTGYWEEDNYILLRKDSEEEIATKNKIPAEELKKIISSSKRKLLEAREKRVRPGLDDKSLTSWNALMLKGFVDAYLVFDEKKFLDAALKNAGFIVEQQRKEDRSLFHSYKKGQSKINGYLDDYCFTIEAFISLYEATFDEKWLKISRELADYCLLYFYDEKTKMFFFTSDEDEKLVARKMELNDNVIPGSCSSIAKGLFLLGHFFDSRDYLEKSDMMLNNIKNYIRNYGSSYSNWCQLMLWNVHPFYEIAICGTDAQIKRKEFERIYFPNKIFIGSAKDSKLPLLENKFVEGKTMIYVCQNKVCQLPVTDTAEALKQLK